MHGCDHNNNEYGADDHALLLEKNYRALERMNHHFARTGIPCTPIAVCPQEQCSLSAWRAFADHPDMLAMMNTRTMPRSGSEDGVRGSDLLLPAQDALFGIPAFKRHYPGKPSRFALDLFLGKPAILVEHHTYFRDGPGAVEEFAKSLREINPAVRWPSLEQIATGTHLRRKDPNGLTSLRFFTHRFEFTAAPTDSGAYQLRKRVRDPANVRAFQIEGQSVPFMREGEFVCAEVTVEPGRRVKVSLEREPSPARVHYSFGLIYQAGVATRRLFSEVRDDYVAHSPFAVKCAQSVLRLARLTGDSRRGPTGKAS